MIKRPNLPVGKLLVPLLSLLGLLAMAGPGEAQPTTVPAAPTEPQGHVISLYNSSGTYTNIDNVNFFEEWWALQWTGYGDYPVADTGYSVKGYLGLLFCGVGFESNVQNLSGCTNLHVDVFTPNGDHFSVRIVDNSGHSADLVFSQPDGKITANTWISLDMPLSGFTAVNPQVDLSRIQQLGWIINDTINGNPDGTQPADYYVDNVYFSAGTNLVYVPPPTVPVPTNNAPLPTQPADQVLSMYNSSGTYTDHSGINWYAGWSGAAGSDFTIAETSAVVKKYASLQYAGVEFYDPNQIDATGYNTLHVDVWSPDANQFGVQIVSLNPTIGPQVNFTPDSGTITTNKWIGLDIPLSAFTNVNPALVLSDLQQLLWIDNQNGGLTGSTFYVDNVYFYNAAAVALPPVITPGMSGGMVSLAFATQNGFTYTVKYKDNLTDSTWQTLTSVPGNGAVQSVSDPATQAHRFYQVSVQ